MPVHAPAPHRNAGKLYGGMKSSDPADLECKRLSQCGAKKGEKLPWGIFHAKAQNYIVRTGSVKFVSSISIPISLIITIYDKKSIVLSFCLHLSAEPVLNSHSFFRSKTGRLQAKCIMHKNIENIVAGKTITAAAVFEDGLKGGREENGIRLERNSAEGSEISRPAV